MLTVKYVINTSGTSKPEFSMYNPELQMSSLDLRVKLEKKQTGKIIQFGFGRATLLD